MVLLTSAKADVGQDERDRDASRGRTSVAVLQPPVGHLREHRRPRMGLRRKPHTLNFSTNRSRGAVAQSVERPNERSRSGATLLTEVTWVRTPGATIIFSLITLWHRSYEKS